ncbi:hypothetical protein FALBO_2224, partial [Fusarium albosuccineum]
MPNPLLPTDEATATAQQPGQLPKGKRDRLEKLGLHYNSPEPAIICTQCGFAINPNRASRHPGDKHDIPKSARWGLKPLISSLALPDPASLALRPEGSQPHPHLTVQKGSACRHCGLRSASEKVLAAHLRTEHPDRVRVAARQRTHHWLRDHVQPGLSWQSWAANDVQRSWLVLPGDQPGQRPCVHGGRILLQASPAPIKHFTQKLVAEERARLGDGQVCGQGPQHNSDAAAASSDLQTNWIRRTGWQTIFGAARRDILVRLTEMPARRPSQPLLLG